MIVLLKRYLQFYSYNQIDRQSSEFPRFKKFYVYFIGNQLSIAVDVKRLSHGVDRLFD